MAKKSKFILHQFELGDVDDPEIYLAQPVWEWQQSFEGKQVMNYVKGNLYYHINPSKYGFGYTITITGDIEGKYATYYSLLGRRNGWNK